MTAPTCLTVAQAMRLSGLGKTAIGNACRSRAVRCEKVPSGPKNVPAYLIDAASFAEWLGARSGPARTEWSPADEAALLELYREGVPLKQAAAYLGRPSTSVQSKARALRRRGEHVPALSKHAVPWLVPATGVLVARSCIACGEVRDAHQFPSRGGRNASGHRNFRCNRCANSQNKANRGRHTYPAVMERLNEVTRARAVNHGKPWSEPEVRVLRDTGKSTLEVAIELGRSLYAVQHKRVLVGATLTPARGQRRPQVPAAWRIDTAVEARAMGEVLAQLGITAPEALYGVDEGWVEEAAS